MIIIRIVTQHRRINYSNSDAALQQYLYVTLATTTLLSHYDDATQRSSTVPAMAMLAAHWHWQPLRAACGH